MLLDFLADMYATKPTAAQQDARNAFIKDPDAVMAKYGLSEEQKKAVHSKSLHQVVKHLHSELEKAPSAKTSPNW